MNTYKLVSYSPAMQLPDALFNGLYNGEPALILFRNNEPHYVQFIANHAATAGKHATTHCIYDKSGILASSVEILLPADHPCCFIGERAPFSTYVTGG